MFRLFESIRYENGIYVNLESHQVRVDKAFNKLFPGYRPLLLTDIIEEIEPLKGIFKCRISYDQHSYKIQIEPYQKEPPATLKLVYDDSLNYDLKYEDRVGLNRLFDLRSGNDDVLIIKNKLVTDTTIGNICFEKEGKWYTPSKPLLQGTQRYLLINKGNLIERDILESEINTFSHFMVINAMLPFDLNRAITIKNINK